MHYRIEHVNRYRYSQPVFLEPHLIRLHPRSDSWQRLDEHVLTTEPEPTGMSRWTDAEGTTVTKVWFTNLTDVLTVTAVSDVTTLKENPFDYLPEFGETLPLEYGLDSGALSHYLHVRHRADILETFVRELLDKSGNDHGKYLQALMDTIRTRVRSIHREEGVPHHPAETLVLGQGACRDTALLFMEACRYAGIAARFASGYHAGGDDPDGRELHAWPEVYIPGGGWRGYDPSDGLAVSDQHVALASSADPALAAPVTGTFRGTDAFVSTEYRLNISVGTDTTA